MRGDRELIFQYVGRDKVEDFTLRGARAGEKGRSKGGRGYLCCKSPTSRARGFGTP